MNLCWCVRIFNMEDMRMCSQIQERAKVVLNSEGEYPAAAAALLPIPTCLGKKGYVVVLFLHPLQMMVPSLLRLRLS